MEKLYRYQKECIRQLLDGKRVVISEPGCLAADTPIAMADRSFKRVQDLKRGDKIISYDEHINKFVSGTVDVVIRTSHKPKPMIQLEHDGEKITTTYDHPFFNGEGYYPLYQLIWGALEASQRVQLKLLCEQYGQAFDDKAVRCKHCESNEPCKGRMWLLQDNDGRTHSKSAQNSCRELVEEPYKLAMCEPHKWRQDGQQGRKSGVVYCQVQCMVGAQTWEHKSSQKSEQRYVSDARRERNDEAFLRDKYFNAEEKFREEESLRYSSGDVPQVQQRQNSILCDWKIEVKVSEPYYSISLREAPYTYCIGRKHLFITHNTGKTAMLFGWLECMHPTHVLIVSTPSKIASGDFYTEVDKFTTPGWKTSLTSFECVSWYMLHKWLADKTYAEMSEYTVVYDEIQKACGGISTRLGKSFLNLSKHCKAWTGYTGTPGDTWEKLHPYFIACGKVRNKTAFQREFCIMQHQPFPRILAYKNENLLKGWWNEIAYAPDTSVVMSQLPKETHQTVTFPKPRGYDKVKRTSTTLDGELLESNMALLHCLRQMCATPDKLSALSDILESLSSLSPLVVFYNYTCEREQILELAAKIKRKVWRIDGEKHEIPTADTIGKDDIVLCHYLSGSEALNLQFCNRWLSYSYNYSYSMSVQARGRIKRIGQKEPMFFTYYETEKTVEQDVKKALQAKSDFAVEQWRP